MLSIATFAAVSWASVHFQAYANNDSDIVVQTDRRVPECRTLRPAQRKLQCKRTLHSISYWSCSSFLVAPATSTAQPEVTVANRQERQGVQIVISQKIL